MQYKTETDCYVKTIINSLSKHSFSHCLHTQGRLEKVQRHRRRALLLVEENYKEAQFHLNADYSKMTLQLSLQTTSKYGSLKLFFKKVNF